MANNVKRCDCENELCQLDHQIGNCLETATVRVIFGKLCAPCATYLPAELRIDMRGDVPLAVLQNLKATVVPLERPRLMRFSFDRVNKDDSLSHEEIVDWPDLEASGFFDDPEVTRLALYTLKIGDSLRYGGGAGILMQITRFADHEAECDKVVLGRACNCNELWWPQRLAAIAAREPLNTEVDLIDRSSDERTATCPDCGQGLSSQPKPMPPHNAPYFECPKCGCLFQSQTERIDTPVAVGSDEA